MSRKARGLWTDVVVLYSNEDKKKDEGFWGRIWGMVGGCKGVFCKGDKEEFGST